MEQRIIQEELKKIVASRGGKKPAKGMRKMLEPKEYVNQYEDDGSLAYEKLLADITKKLAQALYPEAVSIDPLQAYANVKQKDIDRVLKVLRDKRQAAIDELKRKDAKIDALVEDAERLKKAEKKQAIRKNLRGLTEDEIYDLKHEDYDEWSKYGEVLPAKEMKPKTKKLLELKGEGRRRSDASGHKAFIKEYFAKHHKSGHSAPETMKKANRAWMAQK